MSDAADGQDTTPRAPRPHVFIGVTMLALALGLFVAWAVVLRPAANEATVTPDELVNSDAEPDVADVAEVGEPAPAVTLKSFEGTDVTLASLQGKPVVINFWASTCVPCVKEMPLIERVYQELGDTVTFLGVDVFESPDLGREMIARTGVTYQQTVDPTNEVLTTFGGTQLPHTVVLSADGTVAAVHNEAITEDAELRELIAAAAR